MAFMRRIVWFDKKGRKHVTFRTMGDDAGDGIELDAPGTVTETHNCPGDSSWNAQLGKCVSPDGSTPSGLPDFVVEIASKLKDAVTSPFDSPAPVTATASGPAAPSPAAAGISTPMLVAGALAGAYFLFGRKKGKR